MDASSTFFRHPVVLGFSLLALSLTGCSSRPIPQEPKVHPGLAVFNEALTLPVLEHSIVREGDKVTYLVTRVGNTAIYARFNASCKQGPNSMFYPTRNGLSAFTDQPMTSTALPAEQSQQLQHSAQLQQVCTQRPTPDWRMLELAEDQDWLMLDRNSLQQEGGLLYVWAGRDYRHYLIASDGAALIAQSQERLALDCKQQTVTALSQFMIDGSHEVSSGKVERQAVPQPLMQASADRQRVFKTACLPQAELARLPVFNARQTLPPVISTPTVAPSVVAAIQALDLPTPARPLRHLGYRYDMVMFNGAKLGDFSKEVFISTDSASGQTLVQPVDFVLPPAINLTFRGLFDLASHNIDKETGKEVADSRPLVDLSFQGDWRNLPLKTQVSYIETRAEPANADGSPSHKTSEPRTVTCQIVREQPASALHPTLLGSAKLLNCTKMKARGLDWTDLSWYLADYGQFVHVLENSPVGLWKWRIESVR
ncbi:hypothetical protein [Pseudomonas helvetica]|uniref:hypothetical protein n=1 Tax=Pseudomonas helvetica TaxID=3136738 RepID=UPI003264193D